MSYKSKEKSFFENVITEKKEDLQELEEKSTKEVLKWYDFGSSHLRAEIKRRPAQYFFLFISTFLGSVITSSIALLGMTGNLLTFISPPVAPKANAVVVRQIPVEKVATTKYDPLLLASKLRKKDPTIEVVDIRNKEDFEKGHILNATNVPVYDSILVNESGELIPNALKTVFEKYIKTDKLLIIYAQNSYSTLPVDIVNILNSDSKKVKALAVGWEEWLHLQGN